VIGDTEYPNGVPKGDTLKDSEASKLSIRPENSGKESREFWNEF
jgi:hypothetical protein